MGIKRQGFIERAYGFINALDYYAAARETAKRRVDGAETVYNNLEPFLKHKKTADGKPTAKKVKRDINALSQGKRDGMHSCGSKRETEADRRQTQGD